MWNPDHGGMFGNDEEVRLGHEGALMHLLDPNELGLARLEATGETVTGRPAAIVRAVPRSEDAVMEPGYPARENALALVGRRSRL
jgi:hypothetical protein